MFAEKIDADVLVQKQVSSQETELRDLTDLQLALVGGGIGETAI